MATSKTKKKPVTAAEERARFLKAFRLLTVLDALIAGRVTEETFLDLPAAAWKLTAKVLGVRQPSKETIALVIALAAAREEALEILDEVDREALATGGPGSQA